MDKQSTTKSHVTISTIRYEERIKIKAIWVLKILYNMYMHEIRQMYMNEKIKKAFNDYANIKIPEPFHDIGLAEQKAFEQSSSDMLIKTKKFDYPHKKRKKQK